MKHLMIILAIAISSCGFTLKAQNTGNTGSGSGSEQNEPVYMSAYQMPTFPEGEAALMKWIDQHIIYPQSAIVNNIDAKVIVQFVVTKTGKVGKVNVVMSAGPDLDKEAIRVCKSLPDFIPGRMNGGQAVNVWYTLPICFRPHSK